MQMTPEQAQRFLDNVWMGRCKYCFEGYSVNKDGRLRKHKKCPQDYPSHTMVGVPHPETGGGVLIWADLGDLALIANAKKGG